MHSPAVLVYLSRGVALRGRREDNHARPAVRDKDIDDRSLIFGVRKVRYGRSPRVGRVSRRRWKHTSGNDAERHAHDLQPVHAKLLSPLSDSGRGAGTFRVMVAERERDETRAIGKCQLVAQASYRTQIAQ